MDDERSRTKQALIWIRELYAIERTAMEQKLDPVERKELRLEKTLPHHQRAG